MHALQCPADSVRTQWEKAIEELEDRLVTMRTNTSIIKVWNSRLLGWQDQTQFPFSPFSLEKTTYHTVIEQNSINWSYFLIGRLSSKWIDVQYKQIVMTSTKWKRSSTQWLYNAIIAVWKVDWKQQEYRNTILHNDQHPWKQREIRDIDIQIQKYKTKYQPSLYLPRDKELFLHLTKFIHQYPKQIKQQCLQSVATARLRKIVADATVISQERRILRNWLRESDRPRLTITNDTSTLAVEERSIILFVGPFTGDNNNVTEERVTIIPEPVTPTTLATTERTTAHRSKRIQREYRKRRQSKTKSDGQSLLPSTVRTQLTKRRRLIPLSIVRTTNYQYERVMKIKRKEEKSDSKNLAHNESSQSKIA